MSSKQSRWKKQDFDNFFAKYPIFASRFCLPNPFLFSEFNFTEYDGNLWMTSRATIQINDMNCAAMLVKIPEGAKPGDFFQYALIEGMGQNAKPILGAWKKEQHLPCAYGEMCAKNLACEKGLVLPEENNHGSDWVDLGRRLNEMGCLKYYHGDFFWHDRQMLLDSDSNAERLVIAARETGTWSVPNNDDLQEWAKDMVRIGSKALVVITPGKADIIDMRALEPSEKVDLIVSEAQKCPPYVCNNYIPLSQFVVAQRAKEKGQPWQMVENTKAIEETKREHQALLNAISDAVALAINDSCEENSLTRNLEDIFPEDMSADEKYGLLEEAIVFSCDWHMPGCLPDNEPFAVSSDTDLKQMVIGEVESRLDDFLSGDETDEERQEADELLQDLKNAETGAFAGGTDVSCPDGYIFSVEKFSCAELLNLKDIELDFEENAKKEFVNYIPLDGKIPE